jgi:hypothetical protein
VGDLQRREFHEALLDAATFEDLPAILDDPAFRLDQTGCGTKSAGQKPENLPRSYTIVRAGAEWG